MNRRHFLRTTVAAALGTATAPLLGFGRCRVLGAAEVTVSTRAVDLVRGSLVVDMLGLLTLDWQKLFAWQRSPEAFTLGDFRLLERSGVDVFHPAVETASVDPYLGARRWLTGWNRLLAAQPCFLARVDSTADLERARRRGLLGVVLGFQDADHFRNVGDVASFHRLGLRVSQLTYNGRNRIGSGCYEPRDSGLTRYGVEIVAAMNDVGMAIDLSHCGPRTTRDAIAASSRPVLVTHSNAAALAPGQPRNKSDSLIRQLAAGGGVFGITTVRPFVGRRQWPTIDDLLDHFDHVGRLVGRDHVGIGSDVDILALDPKTGRRHPFYAIRGLDPVARVFQIADGLLRRGWSERDVRLVLGGNFVRALAEIWRQPVPEAGVRGAERDPFCPAPLHAAPAPA